MNDIKLKSYLSYFSLKDLNMHGEEITLEILDNEEYINNIIKKQVAKKIWLSNLTFIFSIISTIFFLVLDFNTKQLLLSIIYIAIFSVGIMIRTSQKEEFNNIYKALVAEKRRKILYPEELEYNEIFIANTEIEEYANQMNVYNYNNYNNEFDNEYNEFDQYCDNQNKNFKNTL